MYLYLQIYNFLVPTPTRFFDLLLVISVNCLIVDYILIYKQRYILPIEHESRELWMNA
jgi:hypothetical protein